MSSSLSISDHIRASNCLNFDIYKDCKDVPKFSLHLLVRISNLVTLAKQPCPRLLVVIFWANSPKIREIFGVLQRVQYRPIHA